MSVHGSIPLVAIISSHTRIRPMEMLWASFSFFNATMSSYLSDPPVERYFIFHYYIGVLGSCGMIYHASSLLYGGSLY